MGLVGICAIWGLTFVMVKDAVAVIPAMAFLTYRFISAAILVALLFPKRLKGLSRDGWRVGLVMGAFLTTGYVLQTLGLERTSAANAGFITGMFVVLTPVFGALFLRHRIGLQAWVAAAVAGVGLYLISGSGGRVHAVGDLLVFGCACAFSFHILATDRGVKGHDPAALLVVQLGLCGVFSLIVSAAQGDLPLPRSSTVWVALLVTTVFASAVAFWIQTWAQLKVPPARTALILASEPAFAGLFAYIVQGVTLSALGWLGAVLIMGAIVAVVLVPYLRPIRPLPEG
jgi:drug/metabolite transporter (DMT)-like permease